MLKIKIKNLADEAKLIRRAERQALQNESWLRDHEGDPVEIGMGLSYELHCHRVQVVRKAARDTHIAYGLIRGRTLEQMEPTAKSQPDWQKVNIMILRYGSREMQKKVKALKNQTMPLEA